MNDDKIFTINSRKFDGKIHRTWVAEVVKETESLIVFKGVFDSEVKHRQLGVIRLGTISYEFYWKTRWYNIFRFHEPTGELRNFYCNINKPPTIKNSVLDFIDLDVDVLVWKDFKFEILDLDEFDENSKRFGYSVKMREKVNETLDEILALIKNRQFPFDYEM